MLCVSAAFAVLIAIIIIIARGCSGRRTDVLCGRWDLDGTTVYVFDGEGSGTLELPESSYAFQYVIKDGTVSIDFVDEKAHDSAYEFTVEDDVLTLIGKEEKETSAYTFKKQEDNGSH